MANVSMLAFEGYPLSWWSALPNAVQESYLDSWNAMKAAIQSEVLSINWFESQLLRLERMRFRDQGHDKETPQQYLERKFKLNRRLRPLPDSPTEHHYSNEVVIVWDHVPTSWHAHIDINECGDIATLLKEAGDKQRALLAADTSDISCLVQAEVARATRQAQYATGRRPYHQAQVVEEEDDTEEPPMDTPALTVTPAPVKAASGNGLFTYPRSDNASKKMPPRPC